MSAGQINPRRANTIEGQHCDFRSWAYVERLGTTGDEATRAITTSNEEAKNTRNNGEKSRASRRVVNWHNVSSDGSKVTKPNHRDSLCALTRHLVTPNSFARSLVAGELGKVLIEDLSSSIVDGSLAGSKSLRCVALQNGDCSAKRLSCDRAGQGPDAGGKL